MKKLIMLVSAAMLRCAVSAASFTWGFYSSDIMDSTGNYLEGGTAFLYLGTVTASAAAFDTSAATYITLSGQTSDYNFGSFDGSNPATSDLIPSTDAGQAYTLILLEKSDTATLAGYNGKYILATGVSGQDVDPMTSATWAKFINTTAYTGSAWQTMSNVPEPTSGLLILLGMAGLMLKRKRA